MEYFDGIKPDLRAATALTSEQKNKVVDLGVGAIIQMIFLDGFYHADLHPADLIIFEDCTVGFIDLGMVGSFDREMQRLLSYYFYSLVTGDPRESARAISPQLPCPAKTATWTGSGAP